jgi:hypothetical protein
MTLKYYKKIQVRGLKGTLHLYLICTFLLLFIASCSDSSLDPNTSPTATLELEGLQSKGKGLTSGSYAFEGPVFDISATPDGGVLVAETIFPGTGSETSIKKITGRGVRTITDVQTVFGSPINGIAALGSQNFFAAGGGLDLAVGAKIFQVTPGGQRMVGDIEAYEIANDPDANTSPRWKNILCEKDPSQGFSVGPQSNPYHLTVFKDKGEEAGVLVAEAAGNSLLKVDSEGHIALVAVFTPPVDEQGNYLFLKTALSDETVDCYVQPVPTSVAIGPNGDYFVGELTGSVPESMGFPIGLSRVWKIKSGSEGVACPSSDCTLVKDGLTSIMDLEFGPDGMLYVVQNSLSSWVSAFVPSVPNTGNVLRCDPNSGNCDSDPVASGDLLSAITFDKWGDLWLLENNLGGVFPFLTGKPMVKKIELD